MVNRGCVLTVFILVSTATAGSLLWAEESTVPVQPQDQAKVQAQESTVASRSEKLLEELIARMQPPAKKEESNHILMSKEVVMLDKTVSGEITGRGSNGIALAYDRNPDQETAKEMWFPFAESIQLKGYKERREIKEGDHVKVFYQEADNGSSRVLRAIVNESTSGEQANQAAPAPSGAKNGQK